MRISPDSTVKVEPESLDDSAAGAALSTLGTAFLRSGSAS